MLNERIKELRIAKGLSQVELSKKLNVTKQCVSNWENDNISPSIEMLIKLANTFSVITDYLLGIDDRKYLLVDELTEEQLTHLRLIINDITQKNNREL